MTTGESWPRDPADPRDPDLCAMSTGLLCAAPLVAVLIVAAPFIVMFWVWRIIRAARAACEN
ncbi:MAG TPA: hypothetical protein ENI79_03125 [Rhodospirillales bacterium]|nr:hypothetical protein [Rhodospirillales bacterium]